MDTIDYNLLNNLIAFAIVFMAFLLILFILAFVVIIYYFGIKCQRIEDKNFKDKVRYVIKDINKNE